jgi:hypothetical protein
MQTGEASCRGFLSQTTAYRAVHKRGSLLFCCFVSEICVRSVYEQGMMLCKVRGMGECKRSYSLLECQRAITLLRSHDHHRGHVRSISKLVNGRF